MKIFVGRAAFAAAAFVIFANCLSVDCQVDSIYRLPAGTRIWLKMDGGINSKASSVNDTFTSVVSKPLTVRDTVVLPAGAVIEGRVSSVSHAASGRDGMLSVVFETLRIKKEAARAVDGVLLHNLEPNSSATSTFLTIIGGAGVGALVGSASKSGSGIAIGAGIGAGVGTAVSFLKKGKNVGIKGSEEFEIELRKEVVLPVRDY